MANNETFLSVSNQMADVAERAGAFVLQVRGRGWRAAAGTVCLREHIVVAEHAVEREENLTVRTADGRALAASLAGRDAATGLAVLKVPDLAAPPASPSQSPPRIGQVALAIGRGLSGGLVAGLGVISSVGGPWRSWRGPAVEQVIRTDATAYPGFAGGALVAADGTVIGIASGVLVRGLGLVIPAATAWSVASTIAQHGRIRRPFLGIAGQPVRVPRSQYAEGPAPAVLVVGVSDDSPASTAGLMVGDVVLSFNGHAVEDPETLLTLMTGDLVDQVVPVQILRAGTVQIVNVTLTERQARGK